MMRLLFFILMPIIFEFVEILIFHFSNNWIKSIKVDTYIFLILLGVDYVIEFVYLLLVKNILGVWIFSQEFDAVKASEAYSVFVTLSIGYVVVSILFSLMFYTHFSDQLPITHTIILIGCFIIFCIAQTSSMHEFQDETVFSSLEYYEEETTIYLKALEDGREVSGEIYGSGNYIRGKIETDYYLYYAFIDEDGKAIIRSIQYDENYVNIHEIGNEGDPRIVFHRNYKSYHCKKGHCRYDEYITYDIFIPSISNIIQIDME